MTVFQDSQDDNDEKCTENTGFYALILGHTTIVFTQCVNTLFKLVYLVDWQTHKWGCFLQLPSLSAHCDPSGTCMSNVSVYLGMPIGEFSFLFLRDFSYFQCAWCLFWFLRFSFSFQTNLLAEFFNVFLAGK